MKIYSLFLKMPEKIRFLICGGVNTVLGYLLFASLYLMLKDTMPNWAIVFIVYLFGTLISFVNFKLFVFKSSASWKMQYSRSLITCAVLYFVNIFLLYLLTDVFGVAALVAQAMVLTVLAICSYLMHKYFSFSQVRFFKK